jgi:hypothetical protein
MDVLGIIRMTRVVALAIFIAASISVADSTNAKADARSDSSVWQYSVPLEAGTERRAYLWIPEHCRHVRAVLFGLQNMLERPMFEDPQIRATAASLDMAIILVSPGAWPEKSIHTQPSLDNRAANEAITGIQDVLTRLAMDSGYSEIEFAPLVLTGHSAASPFIWMVARAWPNRVFALLPFKGYPVERVIDDEPTLKIEQEWAEWGAGWGEVWQKDVRQAVSKIKLAQRPLLGELADLGSGHFEWHHDVTSVISVFLQEAVTARLPSPSSQSAPVKLNRISPNTGVLVDAATLGTSAFKAIPYDDWEGSKSDALWYFDRRMAEAVNRYMLERLAKKPEMINFIVDGNPAPLAGNGFAVIKPEFLPDGIHFRVHAEPLTRSPTSKMFDGQMLGHSPNPITYRVSSGALQQTGTDTFMMGGRSGGLTRQGMPWEPWIVAYQAGDAEYRSADRPAHILIDIRNRLGDSQTLNFEALRNVKRTARTVALVATASSGLPVQFYVESGPAVIEGNNLRLTKIPPRTRFPVHVIVSAYQWGRAGDHPIQSVGPNTEEFLVEK